VGRAGYQLPGKIHRATGGSNQRGTPEKPDPEVGGLGMKARIYGKKISVNISDNFAMTFAKNSIYVLKVTRDAIFIRSPIVRDLVIPILISK
jgi:hypothetical protein